MLDSETKRRIDTCRDILVGKVPDPKSQVEQITVALIYKFMDDMDLESEELGGARKFFTGDFERYRWSKLVASGVSGQDMLNTYSEALTKMVENEHLPALFRTIFRNAYLPYRDPETLRSFLREINSFTYDHSEKLGDAFEYLLSVLGSQGDAGQFRTPRHIIDFIVEVMAPKKNEVILDPACGTAGFLISAYKHILKTNSTKVPQASDEADGADAAEHALESPLRFHGDLLTQVEREQLASNIKGYDISPDMVRLSLVNLYLHGFVDPKVEEYDTLTSDDKWTEMADVILANPPFMSPKGGIKPHTRFQVQSKRSEVLFVDYMAEHLTPQGRAAIIVPEGIIFQSQNTYVALRKMLVDNHLAAVISLPAGVFNPYSGVKTSVLILDRSVAKASNYVAFFKVENDGFALGAQRKAQKGTQLPQVKAELSAWLLDAKTGRGEGLASSLGFSVSRETLKADGDYNLSSERYRTEETRDFDIPRIAIADLCIVNPSKRELQNIPPETEVSFVPMADVSEWQIDFKPSETKQLSEVGPSYTYFADGDVLLAKVTPCFENGKAGIAGGLKNGIGFGSSEFYVLRPREKVLSEWVYRCIMHEAFRAKAIPQMTGTGGLQRVPRAFIEQFGIPLPSLELQREIVAEIESYQRVIDGARSVVDNYCPHIPVGRDWPTRSLAEVALINPDTLIPERAFPGQEFNYFDIASVENHTGRILSPTRLPASEAPSRARRKVVQNDLLISTVRPNLRAFGIFREMPEKAVASTGFAVVRAVDGVSDPVFLLASIRAEASIAQLTSRMEKGSYPSVTLADMAALNFPVPPIEIQQKIAAEIIAEQTIVNGNRELIARFEGKISASIARVWGERNSEEEA